MRVAVTIEHRFDRAPDGAIYTSSMFAYPFWTRYLEVFDHVDVVARVREVNEIDSSYKRSDGESVSFIEVPYYVGPWQYASNFFRIQNAIKEAATPDHATILRVPSRVGSILANHLHRRGLPFALEVVGDPYDVFGPGSLGGVLRPFYRWWFSRALRIQCAKAFAATYVTESALQRRYPPSPDNYSTYYSDVELPESAFVDGPRPQKEGEQPITLIIIGMLAHLYKAHDILISAVGACVKEGLDLHLVIVGDGKFRIQLETQAASVGLEDRVHFTGILPAGEAVIQQLDNADIFVLPSRQEGLPRAMIEAMARGLPCIGSTVGGIPELLPEEDMIPPNDVAALASKINEIATDPARMAQMSERNLTEARKYEEQLLQQRRLAFYQYIHSHTGEQ
jgi:glycosyltransferase involved in cell wall biosynthesis